MSLTVIYLQHRMHYGSDADDKAIGFYSSAAAGYAAVKRLKNLPGFRDSRGKFQFFKCHLDQTVWPEMLDDPAREIPIVDLARDRSTESKTSRVYLLWNMNDVDSDDFEAMLGIYSTQRNAEEAIEALRRDALLTATGREFGVDTYDIDQDHWREGFVSDYLPDAE